MALLQRTVCDVFSLASSPGMVGQGEERKSATCLLTNVLKKEKEKQEAAGWEQHSSHRLGNWKPSGVSPH